MSLLLSNTSGEAIGARVNVIYKILSNVFPSQNQNPNPTIVHFISIQISTVICTRFQNHKTLS